LIEAFTSRGGGRQVAAQPRAIRLSSMGELFSASYGWPAVADRLSDRALVQAMLDVELALARALVRCELAPPAAAEELAPACDASLIDVAALTASIRDQGTPVPGLLSALRARVSDTAAAHLHRGATSQDIVDTAVMLVARRALAVVLAELGRAADACAELARRHRDSLVVGRTLLQHALPLTFGLKAASWLTGIDGARAELTAIRERGLAVQLGGAVGTLAALGDRGLDVVAAVASQLELAEPELPWHTIRLRPARLAAALGTALGAMAKVARDVTLLAQTEVGEAAETGGGGSSTMPHKRNPVGSVTVLACAHRGPGLVATILSSMVQEHERATGGWQAEWAALSELLQLTGAAAAALAEVLDGLEVDAGRMGANLDATRELVMAESVVTALTERLGRDAAQELVKRALAEGRSLRELLLAHPDVSVEALDPKGYLGIAQLLIDRALASHRREG
jgi:3-carboxy-cis,cis-muconate cycloisomerase